MTDKASARATIDAPGVRVTTLKAQDAPTYVGVIGSNSGEPEDDFASLYEGASTAGGEFNVLRPPYDFTTLKNLVYENNTLGQCVSAMEVNIDGTGYVIKPRDPKAVIEDDPAIAAITEFFDEPFPGISFTTQRRLLRRDLESTGNASLEVLRNPAGATVFLNYVDITTLRLCKLSEPVEVTKTIARGGVLMPVKIMARERAFVQKIGQTTTYFKEFGSSRDIDKKTGKWAPKGTRLPAKDRGSEIIYFTDLPGVNTPYGVPKWINQAPSVVGSRKAEVFNLEFFDSGGLPPIMVFLSGGTMGNETRKQVENIFNGSAKTKNRGAVIEVTPTGGSLDKDSKADVKVERFGAERQSDAMFEKYDDRCERRVRSAFRLPPLFVGKAEDYNYATALASYSVAEAQVFKPERDEFDEIINNTLMKELNPLYCFRSLPIGVKDVETQIKAIELATTKSAISGEGLITALNECVGITLVYDEETDKEAKEAAKKLPPAGFIADPTAKPPADPAVKAKAGEVKKSEVALILDLVEDYLKVSGLTKGGQEVTETFKTALWGSIDTLEGPDRMLFNNLLASRTLVAAHHDLEGASELCGCASLL